MTDGVRAAGAFALALAVVVAGAAVGGLVTAGPSDQSAQPSAPSFEAGTLFPETLPDDGGVEAPDGSKTVVVDTSHANAVTPGAIQPFVDALTEAGHEVRLSGASGAASPGLGSSGGGLNATLRSADALVVVSPRTPYTTAEVNGIDAFAEAGGRVLMIAEPAGRSTSGTSLPVPVPIGGSTGAATGPAQPTNLAANFGLSYGSGYLFNTAENANNFQSVYATPAAETLTGDVSRAVLRDAAPLTTGPAVTPVLQVEGELSSTRESGTYTVAARTGNVTAVGDTDIFTPATSTVADNDRFLSNLAAFLTTGEKAEGAPAAAGPDSPPTPPSSGIPGGGITPPGGQPDNGTAPGGPPAPDGNGTAPNGSAP